MIILDEQKAKLAEAQKMLEEAAESLNVVGHLEKNSKAIRSKWRLLIFGKISKRRMK